MTAYLAGHGYSPADARFVAPLSRGRDDIWCTEHGLVCIDLGDTDVVWVLPSAVQRAFDRPGHDPGDEDKIR